MRLNSKSTCESLGACVAIQHPLNTCVLFAKNKGCQKTRNVKFAIQVVVNCFTTLNNILPAPINE